MTRQLDEQRLIHWLSDHDYWWSKGKTEWIHSQPGGWNEDDLYGALDAAVEYFEARGERLHKPLAYVFTANAKGMSMVTRQQHRRMDRTEATAEPLPPIANNILALVQHLLPRTDERYTHFFPTRTDVL